MNAALTLPQSRVRSLVRAGKRRRVLVIGDVLLDQFIWGGVRRISPEAPVPVVDFQRESFMAGGAANVARNLTALGTEARCSALSEPIRLPGTWRRFSSTTA
jgi:bifunctional ADP-heptose synthase (sugar kinase/adenylyltransferase)